MINVDLLLARGGIYKKIHKGEFIFKEGSTCRFYYQLIKGSVSWVNFDEEGKPYIHSIIQPGESFGELPLFDDEPYVANAVAEIESVFIQLPKPVFHQLLKEKPDMHTAFCKLLAQRVRYSFFISKELASHNPESQILSLLDFFRHKNKNIPGEPYRVILTRQQIASMTGLRVETVIRSIKKLNNEGRLLIKRGKVFMLKDDLNHKSFKI